MSEQTTNPGEGKTTFVAQVGGDHYQSELQHWDFIEANRLPYSIGCATKYLQRWREKDGVKDLRKAISYLDKAVALNKAGILKPQPFGLKVPVADYVAANKLPAVEAAATQLIVCWRKASDLEMAKAMIETLITSTGQTGA